MRIKITPDFTETDLQKQTEEVLTIVRKETETILMQIGLEFVRKAREKSPSVLWHRDAKHMVVATKLAGGAIDLANASSFNDDTGNLRNSIGFILYYNGEKAGEDFKATASGGEVGLIEGRKYAEEVARKNPVGWVLVAVAGMEYASWVEAKGYDVISGSTLGIEKKIKEAYDSIVNK